MSAQTHTRNTHHAPQVVSSSLVHRDVGGAEKAAAGRRAGEGGEEPLALLPSQEAQQQNHCLDGEGSRVNNGTEAEECVRVRLGAHMCMCLNESWQQAEEDIQVKVDACCVGKTQKS